MRLGSVFGKILGSVIALIIVFSAVSTTANANLLGSTVYSGKCDASGFGECGGFKFDIKFMETEVTSEDFPTVDPIDEHTEEDKSEKLKIKISITDSTKVCAEKPVNLQKQITQMSVKTENKRYIPAPEDNFQNNMLVISSVAVSFLVILSGIIYIIYKNRKK